MKNKVNTKAFSDLIGGILFAALAIWALMQTFGFQEIKNSPAQPSLFPQIMSIGLLIFSAIVIIQSALKLKTMKEGDPMAEPTGSLNFIKNKGVLGALLVIVLCILFVALFKTLGYVLCAALVGRRDVPDRQARYQDHAAGWHPRAAGDVVRLLQGSVCEYSDGRPPAAEGPRRHDLRKEAPI